MTLALKLLNDKKRKLIRVNSCGVGVIAHSALYLFAHLASKSWVLSC